MGPRLTPMKAPRALVVLGYHCHITPVVRRFLDGVADDIEALLREPRYEGCESRCPPPLLITSGGFTNPRSAPGVSEARVCAEHLQDRGVVLETIRDEEALTTLHNLRGVAAIVGPKRIEADEIVICCDEARRAKIAHVARRLLSGEPTLWTYDFGRTTLQRLVQQNAGLAFDAAALRLPWVERASWRWVLWRNARR